MEGFVSAAPATVDETLGGSALISAPPAASAGRLGRIARPTTKRRRHQRSTHHRGLRRLCHPLRPPGKRERRNIIHTLPPNTNARGSELTVTAFRQEARRAVMRKHHQRRATAPAPGFCCAVSRLRMYGPEPGNTTGRALAKTRSHIVLAHPHNMVEFLYIFEVRGMECEPVHSFSVRQDLKLVARSTDGHSPL